MTISSWYETRLDFYAKKGDKKAAVW